MSAGNFMHFYENLLSLEFRGVTKWGGAKRAQLTERQITMGRREITHLRWTAMGNEKSQQCLIKIQVTIPSLFFQNKLGKNLHLRGWQVRAKKR